MFGEKNKYLQHFLCEERFLYRNMHFSEMYILVYALTLCVKTGVVVLRIKKNLLKLQNRFVGDDANKPSSKQC